MYYFHGNLARYHLIEESDPLMFELALECFCQNRQIIDIKYAPARNACQSNTYTALIIYYEDEDE